jgi:small-conductance mechanosensitive channel
MGVSEVLEPAFWRPLLGSLIGGAVALVAGAALAWLVNTLASRWAQSTHTPVDDIVVKGLASPVRLLLPLSALISAHPWLGLTDSPRNVIRHALVVAITLNVGWVFLRMIRIFEEIVALKASAAGSLRARAAYTQVHGLSNVARFLVGLTTLGMVLLSFSAVREMGVSLLASAGVVGIAVGFAAQKSLAAIVSGLVIAVAQPIRIDDAIVVEGELGIVEEINLTFVVVRLLDRRCIIVPINYFLEKPFQNWSRSSTQVRGAVELVLDYTAPLDLIRTELKRILDEAPQWDRDYWELNVSAANDHGMTVKASMSAADAKKASALKAEVRDKLVLFIQTRCPNAFPRLRTDTQGSGDPRPASKTTLEPHS